MGNKKSRAAQLVLNPDALEYKPSTTLIHAPVVTHATTQPSAPALAFLRSFSEPVQTLSYADLNARSTRLARTLRRLHAASISGRTSTPQTIVSLALPSSIELYIAYLAVLKAGFAFSPLPLPDDTPAERLRELVNELCSQVVIGLGSRQTWAEGLEELQWLNISDGINSGDGDDEWPAPTKDDLAYVMFTSGSTGVPKGVQISHFAVSSSISAHLSVKELPRSARWLQFAASTFDPSIMEIFMTLWSGATLCSADRTLVLTDPERVIRTLECTHMMATPSMAAVLHKQNLGSQFKTIYTMGEMLTNNVIDEFSANDGLLNAYGPTEASINVTLQVHAKGIPGSHLGAPLPSAAFVILPPSGEDALKPLPFGEEGELAIAGPQLALGYLGKPDLTAKSFVEVEDIGRVYRTGDRARIENGGVVLLGRANDMQIKINGKRVEYGEIETNLAKAEGVRFVLCAVHPKTHQLVALLVPERPELDEGALEEAARTKAERVLPSHMRPSGYAFATALPLAPSGKAERRAVANLFDARLAKAAEAGGQDIAEDVDPVVLKIVRESVAEATGLPLDDIRPGSNLYALGVDSLSGVRLLQCLRARGKEGLTIVDVLRSQTLAALARSLALVASSGVEENKTNNVPEINIPEELLARLSHAPERVFPATPTQARVLAAYLAAQPPNDQRAYLYTTVLVLNQDVDESCFRNAWYTLVRRHDALRVAFLGLPAAPAGVPFAACIMPFEVANRWERVCSVEGDDIERTTTEYLEGVHTKINVEGVMVIPAFIQAGADRRFVLTVHHAIIDGGALVLLLEELTNIYNGDVTPATRTSLSEAVTQAYSNSEEESERYWNAKLQGHVAQAFPDLSGLRPHAKSGKNDFVSISSALKWGDFAAASRKFQAPPLAVVQAAWALLLYTYSESDTPSVVFGSVIANRSTDRLASCVAPTFTVVPARLNLGPSPTGEVTNRDVIARFAEDNLGAMHHPVAPMSLFKDGEGMVFDTTVALQLFESGKMQSNVWSAVEWPVMPTEFAVMLELWPNAETGEIAIRATYSTLVLTTAATTCMLEQFDDLLSYLVAHPDAPFISSTSHIRPFLLSAINPSPPNLPTPVPNELLHSQFERNTQERPDALALWYKYSISEDELGQSDVRWTYRELNERANKLARVLRLRFGSLVDEPIPLCVKKSPELYVAILAILKAGGAWCPVDPAAPALRKRDQFTRSRGRIILVSSNTEKETLIRDKALPEDRSVEVIAILDDDTVLAEADGSNLGDVGTKPESMAYMIWTSGTTGLPKGVPITHSAGVQSLSSLHQEIPYRADGVRCIQFSAFTFDVSVQDFFYTWGLPVGTLCSAVQSLLLENFPEVCNSFEVTHAFLTPAFMATTSLKACHTLQTLTSIGEKLPDSVADAWCAPDVTSINTYGPAESTIVSTVRTWTLGEATKAHNVGLPLPTISCFVIKDGLVAPRGAAGELALGGHQNSRGYLGQPNRTAEKFIHHPVAGDVYLTGDVVRILHDGSCEFVGRTDDLIKIGGIRAELSEISAALNQVHPEAQEAATLQLSRPDRPQQVLCTFIAVPSLPSSSTADTSTLAVDIALAARGRAERTLAAYLVPNVFLILKRIPHTASNKIDRTALAEVYKNVDIVSWEQILGSHATDKGSELIDDPRLIEIMEKLSVVIAELTSVSIESIQSSTLLPAVGIDSIRSIQLAARLRQKKMDVAVVDIMQQPTLLRLAELILERQIPQGVEGSMQLDQYASQRKSLSDFSDLWMPKISKKFDHVAQVLPSMPLQEGMVGETIRDHETYWANHCYKLKPDVDIERLRKAWEGVAAEREILRTGFVSSALIDANVKTTSTLLQVIYSKPNVEWLAIETRLPLREVARRRAAEVMSSRANSSLPPWSLTVFAFSDGSRVLMLSIHHSIFDAESMRHLIADVQSSYLGEVLVSRPTTLETLAVALPADPEPALAFWEAQVTKFADPDAQAFPDMTGVSRSAVQVTGFISSRIPTSIPGERLDNFARSLGGSVGNLLQAAWAVLLSAYLETPLVVFGETLSARLTSGVLESALGPLITATPIPVEVDPSATARSLVERLAHLAMSSATFRQVYLARIRDVLKRRKDQAFFPAMFVVHPEHDGSMDVNEHNELWDIEPDIVPLHAEHGLALNVEMRARSIELDIWADSGRISRKQLKLISQQLDAILSIMVAHPDEPIMSLLSSRLATHLLSSSIPDPSPALRLRDIPKRPPTYWLEYFAREHPEYLAAVVASSIDEDGATVTSWTYRELEEASNRVANYILSMGIERKVVAFCMDRSLQAYAYQVGIFKSGNTYLPVDEDLPPARKALLLEDSESALILTTDAHAENFEQLKDRAVIERVNTIEHISRLAAQPSTLPQIEYNPAAPSYLLYTSGSTGKPKGVLVSAGNLSAFIEAFGEIMGPMETFAGNGRYLGRTSVAFDVHLVELFGAFRLGIATATAPRSVILDDLGLAFKHLEISHASLVPSLLERSGLIPSDVPKLRWISVGGEKISARIVDVWGDDPAGLVLFNAYGPTEVTIGCSVVRVNKRTSPRSIGRIFDNCEAFVLKPDTLDLTIRGQAGELCVAGDLVAIGYLNRPDAKGFIEDFHGKRLYRTGDMVRLMVDDTIEYLGRIDDQAKIRGQRLELAEVSECLRSAAPEPITVATLVTQHPALKRDLLVSFIAPVNRRGPTISTIPSIELSESDFCNSLQSICRERLPAFMVPDMILAIDFLPLAVISGKADGKLLRQIFRDTPLDNLLGHKNKEKRPLTSVEEKVRDVLATMVGDDIEINHNTTTLELGIDSLAAISLCARLAAAGFSSPVPYLLRGPSVAEIAKRPLPQTDISANPSTTLVGVRDYFQSLNHHGRSVLSDLDPESIQIVLPSLPLQGGLVSRSLDSPTPLYINHVIFRVPHSARAGLIEAFNAAIVVNDILRTCFGVIDNKIVQVVLNPNAYSNPWVLDKQFPEDNLLSEARMLLDEIAVDISVKLLSIPPLRLSLLSNTEENILVLSMHHSIYDGESLPILLSEVEQRYLGDFNIQRAPFAAVLEHVSAQDIDKSRRFFENYLKDLPTPPELPHVVDSQNYKTIEIEHSGYLSAAAASARSFNVSLHTLAQSAFAIALGEVYNHDDLVFGDVLSGRTIPVKNVHNILAPCITTVPIRARLSAARSLEFVAQQLQRDSELIITHQHTSLRDIQKWLQADHSLFTLLFSFTHGSKLNLAPQVWEELDASSGIDYPFALEVNARDEENTLIISCAFTATMEEATARRIVDRVSELLLNPMMPIIIHSAVVKATRPSLTQYDESQWTPTEEIIRNTVAQLCEVDKTAVTKNMSFLRLGLDSISSIRLAQSLRAAGIKARSVDILKFPTVGALASYVAEMDDSADLAIDPKSPFSAACAQLTTETMSTIPLLSPTDSIVSIHPASALQSAMLTSTLSSTGTLYVVSHPLALSSSVDLARLRIAWGKVISQSEILRTSFHLGTSVPWVGAIHKDAPLHWHEEVIGNDNQLSEVIQRLSLGAAILEPEALEKPPVIIYLLVCPSKRVLLPIMHHSLYDGTSLPYILSDINNAYHDVVLADRPQFRDALPYLLYRPGDEREFWKRRMTNYQATQIRYFRSVFGPAQLYERKSHSLTAEIERACQEYEVTVQAVALLAWAKVYASLVGSRDIVFGHVVSGRSIPIDRALQAAGPLFNTIPFRTTFLDDQESNEDAVKTQQAAYVAAEPYQHTPLRDIQASWRSGSNQALFDCLFVFQRIEQLTASSAPKLWEPLELPSDSYEPEYSLNIEIEYSNERLVLRAGCRAGLFAKETLQRVVDALDEALTDIIRHPANRAKNVPASLPPLPALTATPERESETAADSTSLPDALDVDESFSEQEELLRVAIIELTGVRKSAVGKRTPFYHFGIDSISAAQLVSRCRRKNLKLSIADVLSGIHIEGTCHALASRENQTQNSVSQIHIPPEVQHNVLAKLHLDAKDVETILPVLPGQLHHLTTWLHSGRTFYEPPFVYRATQPLDYARMFAAWRWLRLHHSVLRTTFVALDAGVTYQVVLKDVPENDPTFLYVELDGPFEEAVKTVLHAEAAKPSDMFTPPVRARHIRVGEQDAFVLIIHHSLYDAWSLPLLFDDLCARYEGHMIETSDNFSALVRHISNVHNEEINKAYWIRSSTGLRPTLLTPRIDLSPSAQNAFIWIRGAVAHASRISATTTSHHVPLPSVILAALARAMAPLYDSDAVPVFGLFQTGRSASFDGIERVAGPMLNLLPLRVRVAGPNEIKQVAIEVQEVLGTRSAHEQVSTSEIARWLGLERQPLYNVLVNLLWHTDRIQEGESSVFERMTMGVPTDFAPMEPLEGITAIDGIDTSFLAKSSLNLDIALNDKTDAIDIAIRSEGALMNETQMKELARSIAREISAAEQELSLAI